MAFRKGEPLKDENEEKRPLVLTGPADQVGSKQLRPRSVQAPHIAPGAVQRMHLGDDLNLEFHAEEHEGDTDTEGRITVAHNLAWTPSAVLVQPEAPQSGSDVFSQASVDEIGPSTFRVRCWGPSGAELDEVEVTFRWVAFR